MYCRTAPSWKRDIGVGVSATKEMASALKKQVTGYTAGAIALESENGHTVSHARRENLPLSSCLSGDDPEEPSGTARQQRHSAGVSAWSR